MRTLVLLAVGLGVAAAAGAAFFALRPPRCDGRVHSRADRLAGEPGPDGEFEFPLSDDGCLQVRYSTRKGENVGLTLFEQLPGGGERPRLVTTQLPGARQWEPAWSSLDLPALPDKWLPTDLATLTWYGYSETGEPRERVERAYENRGQLIHEQRFSYQHGQWQAGASRSVRLDVGPDRFPHDPPRSPY
jgi:hypothetical protein